MKPGFGIDFWIFFFRNLSFRTFTCLNVARNLIPSSVSTTCVSKQGKLFYELPYIFYKVSVELKPPKVFNVFHFQFITGFTFCTF